MPCRILALASNFRPTLSLLLGPARWPSAPWLRPRGVSRLTLSASLLGGLALAPLRPQSAHPPDALVVADSVGFARRLAPHATNIRIEIGSAALAHGAPTFRSNFREKLRAVLLPDGHAAAPCILRAGARPPATFRRFALRCDCRLRRLLACCQGSPPILHSGGDGYVSHLRRATSR